MIFQTSPRRPSNGNSRSRRRSCFDTFEEGITLIKQVLRRSPLYRPLRRIMRILKGKEEHPLQHMPTVPNLDYVTLGTEYGGWTFVHDDSLYGSTIVSAGLGEDASFDVEFAKRYGARVVIVDPTPRAIEHFESITLRFDCPAELPYVGSGKEPVEAYDLEGVMPSSLQFLSRALWTEETELEFFAPKNPAHVSHSIVNWQHDYSRSGPSIRVKAITLAMILQELDLEGSSLPILKLDIEGAEIEVLTDCMRLGIRPKQILVEFDELNSPSKRGFDRIAGVHQTLILNGYSMVRTDGGSDFLYLLGAYG